MQCKRGSGSNICKFFEIHNSIIVVEIVEQMVDTFHLELH